MKTRRTIKPVSITIIAAFVVCLCAACFAAALSSSYFNRTAFMGTQVCAGFITTPRFQAGVSWVSPLSSYLPPLMMSPTAVCASLPFIPTTSFFGLYREIMFPP
ncbi:MAG: hypothetical protein EHM41_24790 [Chloroflexi bacterium]|nr:MAG: hypothetical protein EHM41_24790 [Chloroflexota bacterium]